MAMTSNEKRGRRNNPCPCGSEKNTKGVVWKAVKMKTIFPQDMNPVAMVMGCFYAFTRLLKLAKENK